MKLGLLGSHNLKSKGLLVKLGLFGPEQTIRPVPALQQLQKLLVKLSLLESKSRVPRLDPKSQCPLVKMGLLGPEQMAGAVPASQQP